jgi:hypothetical protein
MRLSKTLRPLALAIIGSFLLTVAASAAEVRVMIYAAAGIVKEN